MSAAELLIQPTTVTDLVNSSTKDSGEDDGGGGDDGQETKHKNLVWLEDGFQYYEYENLNHYQVVHRLGAFHDDNIMVPFLLNNLLGKGGSGK